MLDAGASWDTLRFTFLLSTKTTFLLVVESTKTLLHYWNNKHIQTMTISRLQVTFQEWVNELYVHYSVCYGEGGWFFIIRLFKSILFFVNWITLNFFHIL